LANKLLVRDIIYILKKFQGGAYLDYISRYSGKVQDSDSVLIFPVNVDFENITCCVFDIIKLKTLYK